MDISHIGTKKKKPPYNKYGRKTGFVYLLKSSNYFKIGFATNIEKRIKTYMTHNPTIELLFFTKAKNCYSWEKKALRSVWSKRLHGEWFIDLSEEDVNKIKILWKMVG